MSVVGAFEGLNEGSSVVGIGVGLSVGGGDGDLFGCREGLGSVGRYVGSSVVGNFVGKLLGSSVVGDLEGTKDGSLVVGIRDGAGFRSSRSPGTPSG